jgi:uncharacterized membrane protein YccC
VTGLGEAAAEVETLWRGLWQELSEIRFGAPRARQCTIAACSVALSVNIAQWLHFDEVWWAGISGFICSQATLPASIERGILRIAGTAAGALVALLLVGWVAYDHVACFLVLTMFSTVGVAGFMVSRYGYAWLFAGLTANLIMLMSLDEPTLALNYAFYRTLEVVVGTICAVLFAYMLAGDEAPPRPAPLPPVDLFGAQWPVLLHALRGGVAVAVLPFVWSWFELPSLSQMAVTVAAVMAVPTLSGTDRDARLIMRRALHRMGGCLIGGAASLACLALNLDNYVLWLSLLSAGVWAGTYVQASERGIGYAGTQGTVVFIITLVQGWAPPLTIMPGIDRFAGMSLGIATLLAVTTLLSFVFGVVRSDEGAGVTG